MKYFSAPLKSVKSYVLVVFSVVGILFAALLFVMSKQVLHHVSRNYLATAADSMADSILINNYNDFLNYNYYNLRLNLDKLFAYESVEYIYVLDKANQPVYERSKKYGINFRDLLQANAEDQRQLDASVVTTVKLLQTDNGYQFGRLIIGLNDKAIAQTIAHYQRTAIFYLLLIYGAALFVIWVCLQKVMRSLEQLKQHIQGVDSLDQPFEVEENDKKGFVEIHQLKLSYQKMLVRLFHYKKKVEEQSRMAAIGSMTAQVVHDLAGPLQSISAAKDYLQKMDHQNPNFTDCVTLLESGCKRITSIAEGLLKHRPEYKGEVALQEKSGFHLQKTLQDLVNEYQLQDKVGAKHSSSLEIITQMPETPIMLYGSQIRLQRALGNLIKNAIEAMQGKGVITISAALENSHVNVSIADNGPGMSRETLQKVLQGGYTEGKVDGHGIGTKVVRDAVKEFGGTLTARSVLDQGTTFSIELPLRARS